MYVVETNSVILLRFTRVLYAGAHFIESAQRALFASVKMSQKQILSMNLKTLVSEFVSDSKSIPKALFHVRTALCELENVSLADFVDESENFT